MGSGGAQLMDDNQQSGSVEALGHLQNIARQLSAWAQAQFNAYPVPTTTTSPKFTGVTLGTTGTTVLIATSSLRHGIIFHNCGATATCYIFPTGISSVPTTSAPAGSLSIAPGSSVVWPSSQFTNVNAGFSGFSGTGSSQPMTVVEFF